MAVATINSISVKPNLCLCREAEDLAALAAAAFMVGLEPTPLIE
jgi:hypothetical protein